MMETIAVPSGKVTFDFGDGTSFTCGLTEAIIATGAILKRRAEANEVGFGYLKEFQKWISSVGGPALDDNQLDVLWDMVGAEYERQKKTRVSRPTSPTSTESTLSD